MVKGDDGRGARRHGDAKIWGSRPGETRWDDDEHARKVNASRGASIGKTKPTLADRKRARRAKRKRTGR